VKDSTLFVVKTKCSDAVPSVETIIINISIKFLTVILDNEFSNASDSKLPLIRAAKTGVQVCT